MSLKRADTMTNVKTTLASLIEHNMQPNKFSINHKIYDHSNFQQSDYDANPYVDKQALDKHNQISKGKGAIKAKMNLSALQENILEAAKKNQPSYILKNKYKFSK